MSMSSRTQRALQHGLRIALRAALLALLVRLVGATPSRADEAMRGAMAAERLDTRIQGRLPRESGVRDLKRTDEKLVAIKIVKTQAVSETGRERPAVSVDRDLKTRRVAASQN